MAMIGWMAGAVAAGAMVAALPACATEPVVAHRTAPACPADVAEWPVDDWLPGTWINSYYTLVVERRDDEVRWTMSREAHPSERWGSKAAMTASGSVAGTTSCTAELRGHYDSSDNSYLPGKPIIYRATWDGGTRMSGLLLGAGREWTPISFTRLAAAASAN